MFSHALRLGAILGILPILTACKPTTVLQANFRWDSLGFPPAINQDTGMVWIDQGADLGGVIVLPAPVPGRPDTERWVRVGLANSDHQASLTARPSNAADDMFHGVGDYTLLVSLFIPKGAGTVTVQFEPRQAPTQFRPPPWLYLEFLPSENVRIDGSPTLQGKAQIVESQQEGYVSFGHFPHDKIFSLWVKLSITGTVDGVTSATGRAALFGPGTSGAQDMTVTGPSLSTSRFGQVRFQRGQGTASFLVTEILVMRDAKS